ncbi:immunoglobulin superfamily member 5 isoform X2 [Tachyglossus aculeatus]|uniref:immunoglobulin superfamily member 5 isoform X2 n=1 Tax=Tachyglossus aculeatus TaxID=9261 RepID=UPI0018F65EEB|nr:immunoglobulin superfamily member 5 isoform X2 [Tachyglossus aculeatus]
MEGVWKYFLTILLAVSGSCSHITEGPQNVTVLEGSEARFNCTVSQGWQLILWYINDQVSLSVTVNGPIISSDRIIPESYQSGDYFTSEIIIRDVRRSDSGKIKCGLQNSTKEGIAFLSVQVNGSLCIKNDSLVLIEDKAHEIICEASGWDPLPNISWVIDVLVNHSSYYSFPKPGDLQSLVSILSLTPQGNGTLTCIASMAGLPFTQSVMVHLTVIKSPLEGESLSNTFPTWAIILLAVGLPLLLILIILLVMLFCCGCSCKKRKEASYQSKIRNLSISKPNDGPIQVMWNNGKENYGYSSDEPRNTKISSPPSVTSNFSAPRQGGQVRLPHQIHEEQQQVRTAHSTPTVYPSHPRKIRNATLV